MHIFILSTMLVMVTSLANAGGYEKKGHEKKTHEAHEVKHPATHDAVKHDKASHEKHEIKHEKKEEKKK